MATDNPRGDAMLDICVAVGAIVTIAVLLRLLARWKTKAAFAVDDWLLVASLVPTYGMLVCGGFMVKEGGAGRPIATLTNAEVTIFLKALQATLITYSLTITTVKISILLMYRRIFPTKLFRKTTLFVGGACVAWFVTEVFSDIFQCHPIEAAWDPAFIFSDQCINLEAYFWGISATNMILDVIIFCLPLRMVWELDLPIRQKCILSGIFLMGGFVCIASIMRMITLTILSSKDLTYSIVTPYLWSQLEPSTAILCACLITYRPLFSNVSLGFLTSWSRNRHTPPDGKYMSNGSSQRDSTMQWPFAGPASAGFNSLSDRAAKGDLHVVHVGVAPRGGSPASPASPTGLMDRNGQDDFGYPMVNVKKGNSFV